MTKRDELVNLVLLSYPLEMADVPRAIDRMAYYVSMGLPLIAKEYSIEWLATELRKGLREGRLSLTEKAIAAAENHDDEICDDALRQIYAELRGGALPIRGAGHLQLEAFGQRAVRRDRVKRGRGRRWHDQWLRNIAICVWIDLACRDFGLDATRNRASRRANRKPSAISLIVAALARNKIHLDESSVQQNLWFGLPGELARAIVPTWLVLRNYSEAVRA